MLQTLTTDTFADAVRASLRGPRTAADAAIDEFVKAGRTHAFEVSNCVLRAGTLAAQPDHRIIEAGGTPESRLRTVQLRLELDPWARDLRQRLFGASNAPFSSLRDSAAWIEDCARKQRRPQPAELDKSWALIQQMRPQLDVLERLTRRRHTLIADWGLLAYRTPERGVARYVRVTDPNSRLATLHAAIMDKAATTPLREPVLLAFVLTGGDPVYPSARARALINGDVTIEIFVSDISAKRIAMLRRLASQAFRSRGTTSTGLSENETRLLALVKRRGSPPTGRGTGKYWHAILAVARRERIVRPNTTTQNAVRMQYLRAKRKLGAAGRTAGPARGTAASTTCSACRRAVYVTDVDQKGQCCFCQSTAPGRKRSAPT